MEVRLSTKGLNILETYIKVFVINKKSYKKRKTLQINILLNLKYKKSKIQSIKTPILQVAII